MKTLRRLVAPRADGSYLLPPQMLDKFRDLHGGGRQELLKLFEASGGNKDHIASYVSIAVITVLLHESSAFQIKAVKINQPC